MQQCRAKGSLQGSREGKAQDGGFTAEDKSDQSRKTEDPRRQIIREKKMRTSDILDGFEHVEN